jgi:uncharacterized protein YxjI
MELRIRGVAVSNVRKYDILGEDGRPRYTTEGQVPGQKIGWNNQIHIFDLSGKEIAFVHSIYPSVFGKSEIVIHGEIKGLVKGRLSFFHPRFLVTFPGYRVKSSFLGSHFEIFKNDRSVASFSPKLVSLAGDYALTYSDPEEELNVLCLAIAIDLVGTNGMLGVSSH